MNEFAKALPGTFLKTHGVAMCTAVAIYFPDKFCYLAHISPTDKTYVSGNFKGIFLKRIQTDFLGKLIRKVKYYDMYPYELNKLRFVIIAPHTNSFSGTVDELLNNGIELANIKFLYNPDARSANVSVDISKNSVKAEWNSDRFAYMEYADDVEDLRAIMKKIADK